VCLSAVGQRRRPLVFLLLVLVRVLRPPVLVVRSPLVLVLVLVLVLLSLGLVLVLVLVRLRVVPWPLLGPEHVQCRSQVDHPRCPLHGTGVAMRPRVRRVWAPPLTLACLPFLALFLAFLWLSR